MAARSKNSVIGWLGFLLFPLSVWLFLKLLKTNTPPKKMTSINESWFHYIFPRIIEAGFRGELAKYVFAQAAFETGNFTSQIFKENNNLFGMKLAAIRTTLATGENRGHAKFNSIVDSIKDFALYHKARAYSTVFASLPSYINTLHQKGYFEAEKDAYQKGVELYYNLYFNKG
jgi:hypothetical protein